MLRDKATILVTHQVCARRVGRQAGQGVPVPLGRPPPLGSCLPASCPAVSPPARPPNPHPNSHPHHLSLPRCLPAGRVPAPVRPRVHHGRRQLRVFWPLERRRRPAPVQVPPHLPPAGRRRQRRAGAPRGGPAGGVEPAAGAVGSAAHAAGDLRRCPPARPCLAAPPSSPALPSPPAAPRDQEED